MLIKYRVSNFLSFDDIQTFTMSAGKARSFADRLHINDNTKLLKFMAIYGANASGKSNLVTALEFARRIIIEGLPSSSSNYYCRLSDENKDKDSMFEFTLEIAGAKLIYGFNVQLSNASFKSEWLKTFTSNGKHKTIFERDIVNGTFTVDNYFKNISLNDRLNIYAEDIRHDDSVLFLSLMNKNKDSLYATYEDIHIYKDIYIWFKYKLSVNSPDRPITNFSFLSDDNSINEICTMLSFFGTGVSKLNLSTIPLEKVVNSFSKDIVKDITDVLIEHKKFIEEKHLERIPTVMIRNPFENIIFIIELKDDNTLNAKTLQFNHENTSAVFSLNEESDGTIRLLDLIEVLLTSEKDKVYVIDEINRRLHPLLTYKFIEKYLELAKERQIQLIVTTHESILMDLKLLRKDEINFINKGESGRSEIYSLEKYGERFDKKISTAYLKGHYGAVPTFCESGGE